MVSSDNEDVSVTSTSAPAVPPVNEVLPPLTELAHDVDHVDEDS